MISHKLKACTNHAEFADGERHHEVVFEVACEAPATACALAYIDGVLALSPVRTWVSCFTLICLRDGEFSYVVHLHKPETPRDWEMARHKLALSALEVGSL